MYDFSTAKQFNIPVNTNQSLYLNLQGSIPYKCDLKTNRLLAEEIIDETPGDIVIQDEETSEETINDIDDTAPIYRIEEESNSEASMIIVDSNLQCSTLSKQKNIFPNQLQLLVNKKPFEGLILQKFDLNDDNFKILLICSNSDQFVELPNTNPDFKFVLSHKSACPMLVQNPMVQTYIKYKIIVAILLWIIGIFLVVYGFQFTRISTILLAFLIGVASFTLVLGEAVLDYDSSGASMWIVFIAGLVVGLIYMNLTYNKFLIGCFNFGFSLGTVLSMILNSLFYYKFETNPIYLPLSLSIVTVGTVLGLIGCRFVNSMGILSTSVVGAYIIIKPITWFTGKYQNELLLTKQYMYGFTIVTDYLFYVFLSLIGLIALIGIIIQFKQLKRTMSMDELFTYQDMKYYEMGNVNLQEKQKQKQDKPQVQGFDQEQELDGNVQFMKSITPQRLTHSSKASD